MIGILILYGIGAAALALMMWLSGICCDILRDYADELRNRER